LIFADTGKGARFDVPATMLPFNIKHNPPNGGEAGGDNSPGETRGS